MKRVGVLCGVVTVLLVTGNASALTLGANITVWDGMGTGTGWWGAQEDNEVEPGCVQSQVWDLEGFFLNGTTLSMVGGYDFANGVIGNSIDGAGDLFLDVDGDAVFGPSNDGTGSGNSLVANTFGYDYVLDLDFADGYYTVYAIDAGATVSLTSVYYTQNQESNPWRYIDGGTEVGGGSFEYYSGLADADVAGLAGGTHYAMAFDLSFLGGGTFTSHFTMQCGNDNLMGTGNVPVPEPSTMVLLGLGLVGAALRRRFWA